MSIYNGKKARVFRLGRFCTVVDPRVRLVFIISRCPPSEWTDEQNAYLERYYLPDWKFHFHPNDPVLKEKIDEADLILDDFDTNPFRPVVKVGKGIQKELVEI